MLLLKNVLLGLRNRLPYMWTQRIIIFNEVWLQHAYTLYTLSHTVLHWFSLHSAQCLF